MCKNPVLVVCRMTFQDFLKQYLRVEMCNLNLSDVLCGEDYKWRLTEFNGSWKTGSTAGGNHELRKNVYPPTMSDPLHIDVPLLRPFVVHSQEAYKYLTVLCTQLLCRH